MRAFALMADQCEGALPLRTTGGAVGVPTPPRRASRAGSRLPALRVVALLAVVLATSLARAEVRDRWEVTLVPPPNYDMEAADINNPLGTVTVRGWDRDEVRIVAEKWAQSAALVKHLKVLAGFCTDGSVCVKTYVLVPEGQKAVPVAAGRIDLMMDLPRRLPLKARTFVGDLEAVGMRAGAQLESKSGAIRVRDVDGQVISRTLRGNQTVTAVRGSVELDGVAGDLDLMQVNGERLVAKTVEGSIRVHKVRAQMVRLSTTAGEIWLLDLQTSGGGRYELTTFDGGIRLRPVMPASFDLVARNLRGRLVSKHPLTIKSRSGRVVRASLGPAPSASGASFALTAFGDISVE
jgi:hypothetical protein